MIIIDSLEDLTVALAAARNAGKTIGFVPTMGALHEGHMALIQRAKKDSDIVVSSVYVNPTQFNNAKDLELYPRTPTNDAVLLEQNGCDIAFFPHTDEMYPIGLITPKVPLGRLEELMEGAFRPGHFNGVIQVVYRLFDLIKPDKAFFGLKDFQQVAVIQYMVRYLNLSVEIVPCPTLRETSGLAMSSRNVRLTMEQRSEALIIFKTMELGLNLKDTFSPIETKEKMIIYFDQSSLQLEYLSIVDPVTLEELTDQWVAGATVCIAAFCGEVRLIDNLTLIPRQ